MSVDNEIRGKLALVTGASGGLGAACARDLYSHGCHLALTYSKNKAAVDQLVADLTSSPSSAANGAPPPISTHQVDMASEADIRRLYQEIPRHHNQPGPDILVANAGYGVRIPNIVDIPIEEWDHTLTVNLRSPFICCKLAVPHMTSQHWGRIVLMSSIAAYGGGINGCHYAASKAGLTGMCKNLSLKLAKDGITVNDVAPAMIGETGMIPNAAAVAGTPGDVKNIPVGRLGTPDEVARVVSLMCRTGYMTGQSVVISGGLTGVVG